MSGCAIYVCDLYEISLLVYKPPVASFQTLLKYIWESKNGSVLRTLTLGKILNPSNTSLEATDEAPKAKQQGRISSCLRELVPSEHGCQMSHPKTPSVQI